jgi:hypothetical protein
MLFWGYRRRISVADITSIEKLKLERLFEMEDGYVLDFSNRTFADFMLENTGVDIYDDRYMGATTSKANRLRTFWRIETNYAVGRLLEVMLEYWRTYTLLHRAAMMASSTPLYDDCRKIASRPVEGSAAAHLDAIEPFSDERDVSLLEKSIKESLRDNEPEVALDRLHTFVVKFVRHICDQHGIEYDQKRPLHSLYGQYVKYLMKNGLIESEMTARILRTFISLLEQFNYVRNQQSLAHDNPILNYRESELVVSGVMLVLKFLRSLEEELISKQDFDEENVEWDEIPF